VTPLLVIMGAMVGAPLRYLADRAVAARHDSVFPWGTLVVNVAGSLILGFLAAGVAARGVAPAVWTAAGIGLCGALTTYSTFSFETIRLVRDGSRFYAAMNAVANVGAGLGAGVIGAMLAQAVWR
jgi:CrcB protein